MIMNGSHPAGAGGGGGNDFSNLHTALSHAQFSGGSAPASPASAPTTQGTISPQQAAQAWDKAGGPPAAANNMAQIGMAESSDRPSNIQQGQPPGTTGYGEWQDTPTSGSAGGWGSGGTNPGSNSFGNLLNLQNNAKAAVSIYDKQGYSAFTDPVGENLPQGPPGSPGVPGN